MADIYKIGITLLMTDGVSPVLSRLSHRLLGVHGSVKDIERSFGKWALAIGGVGSIMAGGAILKGMAKVASHGKELLDQQDKLIRAGRTQAQVANLTAEAYAKITKAVPTATGADVLRVANELTLVKGNFGDAAAASAQSLKLEAILGNATGKKAEGEGYNVWRALELGNITMDHEKTDKIMGAIVQAMIVSGGKITGLDFMTAARQGGVAWTNMLQHGPDFVTGVLPTVIQELGGMRTGTSLMTAYQTLTGATTLHKQQFDMLSKIGMIDPSKVTTDKGGRVNVGPGGIVGSELGMSDPFRWTQEVLKPAMEKAGFTTIEQQRSIMTKIFPNRNANRMFDIFLDPQSVMRIHKDRELYKGGMSLDDAYKNYTTNNPKGVEAAFHAQYESMMGAIGAPMMQAALPVMTSITNMFNSIGEFAIAHPTTIRLIGEGFVILGAALIGAGIVALIATIGVGGWLVGGIIALGAALMLVPWADAWNGLVSGIKWLASFLPGFKNPAESGMANDAGLGDIGKPDFVPPGKQSSNSGGVGDVYLDGKKVGAIVSRNQAEAANGPLSGSAYFDGTMSLVPSDYAAARG